MTVNQITDIPKDFIGIKKIEVKYGDHKWLAIYDGNILAIVGTQKFARSFLQKEIEHQNRIHKNQQSFLLKAVQ